MTRVAAVSGDGVIITSVMAVLCVMAGDKSHFVFIQTDLFTRSTVCNDNLGN